MTDLIKIVGSHAHHKNFLEELAYRWSELLNFPVTPVQVVIMLLELKIMRIKNNPEQHEDRIGDGRYVTCLEGVLFDDR